MLTVPIGAVVETLKSGGAAPPMSTARNFFRGLQEEQLKELQHRGTVHSFLVQRGDLVYIPPGHMMAMTPLNNKSACGLRGMVLVGNDIVRRNLAAMHASLMAGSAEEQAEASTQSDKIITPVSPPWGPLSSASSRLFV